jgi:RNase P protein component
MSTLQKLNQRIGYTIGKKVSTRAGLKHEVSRLFKHLSVLLKST